jgi:hypothetical protein
MSEREQQLEAARRMIANHCFSAQSAVVNKWESELYERKEHGTDTWEDAYYTPHTGAVDRELREHYMSPSQPEIIRQAAKDFFEGELPKRFAIHQSPDNSVRLTEEEHKALLEKIKQ